MYPNEIVFDLHLYEICIILGFMLCLIYYRVMADKFGFEAKLQNVTIIAGTFGLVFGYIVSVVFQAFYNWIENGTFVIDEGTGATFYGGLIGGIFGFLFVYFVIGRLIIGKDEPKEQFPLTASIAAPSIAIAHAFGRLGCLFAGCCYGNKTDAWFGVWNAYLKTKVIPVQLFETVFLLLMAAYMTWRLLHGKKRNFPVYMVGYAFWRFFLEYMRNDDRGATVLSFLTPSQLIAVIFFIIGIILLIVRKKDHA